MRANATWLTDPTIFQIHRLPAHSDHIVYATEEEAAQGRSSLRQCLDGCWLFHWSPGFSQRPADFWQEDYDLSHFGTIQVPSHMETQGYGQIQYINKLYPWDGHAQLLPPQVDLEQNPVGSYVCFFDLDAGLQNKDVAISFQGVEQAFSLWLNGHFVGYAEDSFTPSDFDLSPYLRRENNRLCVEVYKRSSAAWLEDQDFFRFSGIFRSVYLYAKASVHVDDVWFQTQLNEDLSSGSLQLRLRLSGHVEQLRLNASISQLFQGDLELQQEGEYWYSPRLSFPVVEPWSHEQPKLYSLLLRLYDGQQLAEVLPYSIGFRRIEIKDKLMLLNGKRLQINGVNRHEWNPHSGRCIGMDDMKAALHQFRENNINAVRTCHYPNRSEWYQLCDEHGIYMMDETNLETHGSWQKDAFQPSVDPSWNVPGSRPEWRDCVLDRAKSMLERDKNHVSVLFWSCGNESFAGQVLVDMANYFRQTDPSRLVHYEGLHWTRDEANGQSDGRYWRPEYEGISDMESRMYATPQEIRRYLENDPPKAYLCCEYMHNMGNSLGGLESYIRLSEDFPLYQGGFVWDYMDQALWYRNNNGEEVLGYGGDFGERQSDYNFSGNGLVTADGKPKPCMQELRYWYSSPEERAKQDAANAQAKASAKLPPLPAKQQPLHIVHGDGAVGVKGDGFEVLFSYSQGGPCSLISNGVEWIYRAPKPSFWRAPTENDIGCGFPQKAAIWSAVDSYLHCCSWEILSESEDMFSMEYRFSALVMPDLSCRLRYTLRREGSLEIDLHYEGKEGRPELPVFGLRFPSPQPVEEVQWLGLSGECYPDRKKGGRFGWHKEAPHLAPYLVPQECGCHMDCMAARLCRGNASLLLEQLEQPFAFSVLPYSPQQLEQALHVEELPLPTRSVISLFGALRGVGGIDTWGSDVETPYHIHSEENQQLHLQIRL